MGEHLFEFAMHGNSEKRLQESGRLDKLEQFFDVFSVYAPMLKIVKNSTGVTIALGFGELAKNGHGPQVTSTMAPLRAMSGSMWRNRQST